MICIGDNFLGDHSAIPESFRPDVRVIHISDPLLGFMAKRFYPGLKITVIDNPRTFQGTAIKLQHIEGGELYITDKDRAASVDASQYRDCTVSHCTVSDWIVKEIVRYRHVTFFDCRFRRNISKMKAVKFVSCKFPKVGNVEHVSCINSGKVEIETHITNLTTDNPDDLEDLSKVRYVTASVVNLNVEVDKRDINKWLSLSLEYSPLIPINHQERLSNILKGEVILERLSVEDARLMLEVTIDVAFHDKQSVHIPSVEDEFITAESRMLAACRINLEEAVDLVGLEIIPNGMNFRFFAYEKYRSLFAAAVFHVYTKNRDVFDDWKNLSLAEELRASVGTCMRGSMNRLINSMVGYVSGIHQKVDDMTRMSFIAGHARRTGKDEIAALIEGGYSLKAAQDFMDLAS